MLVFHILLLPTIGQYRTLSTTRPKQKKKTKTISKYNIDFVNGYNIQLIFWYSGVLFTSHVLKAVKLATKNRIHFALVSFR